MKSHIASLLIGCLLCPAIGAQVTNAPSGSEEHQTHGVGDSLRDKLVGVWNLSITNSTQGGWSGQWMSTDTEYRRDGTFAIKGQTGMLVPAEKTGKTLMIRDGKLAPWQPSSRSVDGGGVWHIDRGILCSTFTHGNWRTNVETRWEIVTLTETEFTYRRETQKVKGKALKATRKR